MFIYRGWGVCFFQNEDPVLENINAEIAPTQHWHVGCIENPTARLWFRAPLPVTSEAGPSINSWKKDVNFGHPSVDYFRGGPQWVRIDTKMK